MLVAPAPAFPFVHHEAWLIASWPPLPGHLLEAGRQPVSVAVPSEPLKLNLGFVSAQRTYWLKWNSSIRGQK